MNPVMVMMMKRLMVIQLLIETSAVSEGSMMIDNKMAGLNVAGQYELIEWSFVVFDQLEML